MQATPNGVLAKKYKETIANFPSEIKLRVVEKYRVIYMLVEAKTLSEVKKNAEEITSKSFFLCRNGFCLTIVLIW